ncbi:hypothetical protein AVEN_199926-1 [Araneus ventricosus]|uniref:Uncharacterized protein n=1 Tax=Araneus ventricosus TaxID=182803 RepID=A0A4Y2PKH4_ARAVE|nr:hypothetical protein AVEN_199926-1 [Araneus ventricosus]
MPTPVPWPAALDYAVDRGGPTDSRLGLNPVSLLATEYGKLILVLFEPRTYTASCMTHRIVLPMNSSQHRCVNQASAAEAHAQQRSLNRC